MRWRLWLAICLAGACAATADAARQPVDCSVEVGFDGAGYRGSLLPVRVSINNRVAGTRGVIRVSQPDVSGGATVYAMQAFESPASSSKRFTVYVRAENHRQLRVDVDFEEYLESVRVRKDVRMGEKRLLLVVNQPRSVAPVSEKEGVQSVYVKAENLPEEPIGYDGVEAVMLRAADVELLNRNVAEALRQWLQTGGRLIVSESPDAAQVTGISRLAGTDVAAARDWHLIPAGAGVVSMPYATETGAGGQWADRRLRGIFFSDYDEANNNIYYGSGLITNLWRFGRSVGRVGLLWVVGIVVLYGLAIWPLDRWLCRRLGRDHATWVIFPLTIALFTVLAYGYSRWMTVGEMRLVSLNVIDTALGANVARGTSMNCVYSARNATYLLQTERADTCFSVVEADGAGLFTSVDVMNARESVIRARIPVFSSRSVDAAWYMPWTNAVSCTHDEQGVAVTVPSDWKVRSLYIVSEVGVHKGDVSNRVESEAGTRYRILTSETQALEVAVAEFVKSMRRYGSGGNRGSEMPDEKAFASALLALSLPVDLSQKIDGKTVDYQVAYYRNEWSARESLLDMRRNLALSRTLMIVVDRSRGFSGFHAKGEYPTRRDVSLLRIRLPPGV